MDWITALDQHGGLVVAVATVAYVVVTLLLWLETRAARVATNEVANVFVRYGTSGSGRATDVAELSNGGPALATDVRLTVAFVDAMGKSMIERSLFFPTLAPGDVVTLMPGLLLPRAKKVMAPTANDLAETGLSLRLDWKWRDSRRRFPMSPSRRVHSQRVNVDLRAYSASLGEGVLLRPTSVEAELQGLREDRDRQRREDRAQRFLDRRDDLPPDIQASVDAEGLKRRIQLWLARLRLARRWLRRRGGDTEARR